MPRPLGHFEAALSDAEDFDTFFRSPEAPALLARLWQRLAPLDALSLDVFDTLLLRDHRSELERFAIIAARFSATFPEGGPSSRACLMARIESAHAAYSHAPPQQGTREARLEDIAQNIVDALRLPPGDHAARWIETELAVEAEQLSLSPILPRLIARARRHGKKVFLLSDMYLGKAELTPLLRFAGADPDWFDAIFSSADLTVNKRSGTVFSHVAARLGLTSTRILHVGDSPRSDLRAPAAAGWSAQLLPVPRNLLLRRLQSHRATATRLFGTPDFPLPMAQPELAE